MEMLINRTPQAANSGPTLLALGAWYLYPDIITLGTDVTHHSFKDTLIAAGGTISMGLKRPENEDDAGVYWCLNFAHLRYYGKSVSSRGRVNHDSSRLNVIQFMRVVFGSVLGCWLIPESSLDMFAKAFIAIEESLTSQRKSRKHSNSQIDGTTSHETTFALKDPLDSPHGLYTFSWLSLLVEAARAFLDTSDMEYSNTRRLVLKGYRMSPKFINAPPREPWPLFRLTETSIMLSCLNGSEARIQALRLYAKSHFPNASRLLIRCSHFPSSTLSVLAPEAQYATVFPFLRSALKRKRGDSTGQENARHQRWFTYLLAAGLPAYAGEDSSYVGLDFFHTSRDHFVVSSESKSETTYHCLFGISEYAAFFADETTYMALTSATSYSNTKPTESKVLVEDLVQVLDHGLIRCSALLSEIDLCISQIKPLKDTFKAISFILIVHKLLPNATISIAVFDRPLYQAN